MRRCLCGCLMYLQSGISATFGLHKLASIRELIKFGIVYLLVLRKEIKQSWIYKYHHYSWISKRFITQWRSLYCAIYNKCILLWRRLFFTFLCVYSWCKRSPPPPPPPPPPFRCVCHTVTNIAPFGHSFDNIRFDKHGALSRLTPFNAAFVSLFLYLSIYLIIYSFIYWLFIYSFIYSYFYGFYWVKVAS